MRLIKDITIDDLPYHTNIVIRCERGQMGAIRQLLQGFNPIDPKKDYDISIKPKKRKRSLDANAYLWVLCDKLADKLRTTKIEVYRTAIREVGVFDTVLLTDKAVDDFIKKWNLNGIGYLAEVSHKSNIEGCTAVRTYYGSHTYDTKEMSRLVDYIIQECKEQGIETLTPRELEELKQKWGCG